MTRASYDPDSLLVGVIGRPHGLDGEMTLRSYNSHGADLTGVPELILERDETRRPHRVRSARRATEGWLVRLEGIDSREDAVALTHVSVRVRKSLLPPLGVGEFFVEDLLGCQVQAESGAPLGIVDSVFWNGAHDVMSIVRNGGGDRGNDEDGADLLIPVVPEFVRVVDARARVVIIAWDGGE